MLSRESSKRGSPSTSFRKLACAPKFPTGHTCADAWPPCAFRSPVLRNPCYARLASLAGECLLWSFFTTPWIAPLSYCWSQLTSRCGAPCQGSKLLVSSFLRFPCISWTPFASSRHTWSGCPHQPSWSFLATEHRLYLSARIEPKPRLPSSLVVLPSNPVSQRLSSQSEQALLRYRARLQPLSVLFHQV